MATTTTQKTTVEPVATQVGKSERPQLRNGRLSGYRHLLWARLLELKREPEVIFWVFVFPLLLAAVLGFAFRDKPADVASVVVIAGDGAEKTQAMLQSPPSTLTS